MRLIQNDSEFLTVAQILLKEVVNGFEEGKYLVYTPDNIELPEEKEVESAEDFVFKGEAQDIDQAECFRLLGVILYHLVKDQSEYNHEAYLVDGTDAYLNLSFESTFWPVVVAMLQGDENALDNIAEATSKSLAQKGENKRALKETDSGQGHLPVVDGRFKLVNSFEITVPKDYNHSTHLDQFRSKYDSDFTNYTSVISDGCFPNASAVLRPGQRFLIKVFQVREDMSHEDCLSFLEKNNASLVGVRGLTLAWHLYEEEFPSGNYIYSLDKVDNLHWNKNFRRYYPGIFRRNEDRGNFELRSDESLLMVGKYILCFNEILGEESAAAGGDEGVDETDVETLDVIGNRIIITGNDHSFVGASIANQLDNIIRVDPANRPESFLRRDVMLYPELQDEGPNEYDINQIEEWHYPESIGNQKSGQTIVDYLVARDDLGAQLGVEDLWAIQAKGIDFFRTHFAGKNIFAWKSAYNDGRVISVPFLTEVSGQVVILYDHSANLWRSRQAGWRFKCLAKIHLIDCNAELFIPEDMIIRPEDQLPNCVTGLLDLTPEKIRLYFPKTHGRASFFQEDKILAHLKNKLVLNANVLDYLLKHPQLIPKECGSIFTLFWGTIYRQPSSGYLYVRYLWKNSPDDLIRGFHQVGHSCSHSTAFALLKDTSIRRFISFLK